jgi:hypothetical protein
VTHHQPITCCNTHQVKGLVSAAGGADGSLVLFSGDAFNPSLMSTMTLGKQMVC